jgi:hypothetical protein
LGCCVPTVDYKLSGKAGASNEVKSELVTGKRHSINPSLSAMMDFWLVCTWHVIVRDIEWHVADFLERSARTKKDLRYS